MTSANPTDAAADVTATSNQPNTHVDSAAPTLELRQVDKHFEDGDEVVHALRAVSCVIHRGEMVALTGPSGSGKSTLLHLAAGLDQPSAGSVLVEGTPVEKMDAAGVAALRRHHVGVVFQRLNLLPTLTVAENVALPLELDGLNTRTARQQAEQALERVGLTGPWDRYPDMLSGGQRQRVAIARALVGERRLLLADEPTGALDTASADDVVELLATLAHDQRCAVVLVTHEPRFAAWADRMLRLRDGQLTEHTAGVAASKGAR